MNDLAAIGDSLIDQNQLKQSKHRFLVESYESYKRANSLLGYFSELRDYTAEYDRLFVRVLEHRNSILCRYKDVLTSEYPHMFKQLLVSPYFTKWYTQGIHKYKKVKNYSTYYYRRKLYVALEDDRVNVYEIKKIIDTIIALDKYYDIYEETIEYIMKTSSKFDKIMRKHFSDCIHI